MNKFLKTAFYSVLACGTMMFLAGLMLGSLVKVWPWKIALESGVDRPILPGQFTGEPHLAGAIIWAIIGALLIVGIEMAAKGFKKGSTSSAA